MAVDLGDAASVVSAGVAALSMVLGYQRMDQHSRDLLAEARDARRRDFEHMRREAQSELNVALTDLTSSSASPAQELHQMARTLRGRVACYADREVKESFNHVFAALMTCRADDSEANRVALADALARLETAVILSQTSIEAQGSVGAVPGA